MTTQADQNGQIAMPYCLHHKIVGHWTKDCPVVGIEQNSSDRKDTTGAASLPYHLDPEDLVDDWHEGPPSLPCPHGRNYSCPHCGFVQDQPSRDTTLRQQLAPFFDLLEAHPDYRRKAEEIIERYSQEIAREARLDAHAYDLHYIAHMSRKDAHQTISDTLAELTQKPQGATDDKS